MAPAKSFEVWVVKKRKYWYWLLKSAHNGKTVSTSETYSSKAKAYQTAYKVAQESGFDFFNVSDISDD